MGYDHAGEHSDKSQGGARGRLAMYRTALNRRWPITPEQRERMVADVYELLDSDSPRVRLGAMRVVEMMERQNQTDEQQASNQAPEEIRVVFVDEAEMRRQALDEDDDA